MANELTRGIIDYVISNKIDCDLIEAQQSKKIIEELAKELQFDLSNLYLWEGVCIGTRFFYADNKENWEDGFSRLLENFNHEIYLAVTDDEFYPWPVFKCKRNEIAGIVKEQRYFEFFVFDSSMKFVLFDTHENELLFVSRNLTVV